MVKIFYDIQCWKTSTKLVLPPLRKLQSPNLIYIALLFSTIEELHGVLNHSIEPECYDVHKITTWIESMHLINEIIKTCFFICPIHSKLSIYTFGTLMLTLQYQKQLLHHSRHYKFWHATGVLRKIILTYYLLAMLHQFWMAI